MANYNAGDARTHFSRLVREANSGENVVVYRRGKPIARIVPYEDDERDKWQKATEALFAGILPSKPGAPNSVELLRQVYEEEP